MTGDIPVNEEVGERRNCLEGVRKNCSEGARKIFERKDCQGKGREG